MEESKMNKHVSDITQLQLLPNHLKSDVHHQALAAAIDVQFLKLMSQMDVLKLYSALDYCSSEVLDLIADEVSLIYYDRSFDMSIKRELIRNGLLFHMQSGTKAAVESLVEIVFGDGRVLEWFEYNGDPYMFKVSTSNPQATTTKASEFIRAVNAYKNLRSHLELVELESTSIISLYSGSAIHSADIFTIRQVI